MANVENELTAETNATEKNGQANGHTRLISIPAGEWTSKDCWPVPKWLEKDCPNIKFENYNAYLRYNLRTRYVALEGDIRTILTNQEDADEVVLNSLTVDRICCLLHTARKALESDEVNLLSISNTLDITEQYMIWLCPEYMARIKLETLGKKLFKIRPVYSSQIETALNSCDTKLPALKALYDAITAEINRETTKAHINYGLQISRLRMLKKLGLITFVATIFLSPLLLNFNNTSIENYKVGVVRQLPPYFQTLLKGWLLITMLTAFGCLGGFISGMLQIKSTSTNLQRYEESLLKFQLKPLLGGITAALLSILLSWNLLPGIVIESLGSFIIIAFLTGFSERYFLKLINVDEQKDEARLVEKAAEIRASPAETQTHTS